MTTEKKEKAIILCGGLGTRLREVIGEKQKTMASVKGEPFLKIVVEYLKKEGINDIIFACGYKKEEIIDYFKDGKDFGINTNYAIEETPLGTGGAIRNSYKFLNDDERVFILNGDTEFMVSLDKLISNMEKFNTSCSIALKKVDDNTRYGSILLKENKESSILKEFNEKVESKLDNSFINGGIYLMKRELISSIEENKKISLEKELFPKWIDEKIIIGGVVCNNGFIDIGTKESYDKIK